MPFVATVTRLAALLAVLTVRVAVVAVTTAFVIVMAGGTDAGENDIVDPVRFSPLTTTVRPVCPASTYGGLIEVIVGTAVTVKLVVEVTVFAPTVTETGPVVAVFGTVTVRVLAVAAVTVAAAR